jgi:hypothetical protein
MIELFPDPQLRLRAAPPIITGVVAIFEKRPNDYFHTTPHGAEFEALVRALCEGCTCC